MRKLIVFATLVLLVISGVVYAQDSNTTDAEKLFADLSKSTSNLKSYKLIFEYTENVPDKETDTWRKCEFWYMGRGYMRLEVLDGDDKGSKVSFNESKSKTKVQAKASYMPIAISVSKDDERLSGFFESDWGSDVGAFAKELKGGAFSYVGDEEIKKRDAYKIEVKVKRDDYDRILLWIDKKDMVLLQYEKFLKGEFQSRKVFYNIELGAQMTPKDFKP